MFSAETTSAVVPAGTWTHISCTYTAMGGKSEIYVNGVLKKEEFTGTGTLSQVTRYPKVTLVKRDRDFHV